MKGHGFSRAGRTEADPAPHGRHIGRPHPAATGCENPAQADLGRTTRLCVPQRYDTIVNHGNCAD